MAQFGRYRFLFVAVVFHMVYIYRSVGARARARHISQRIQARPVVQD